jgi:8-oxo-dGTP diphosphatase
MKSLIVSAAVIMEQGKILLTQRNEDASHGLLWEFPGGKVNEDEEPREALRRKLREELDIEAKVREMVEAVLYFYPERPVLLLTYRCRVKAGQPVPLACRDLRWARLGELEKFTMLPADGPIRERLISLDHDAPSPKREGEKDVG